MNFVYSSIVSSIVSSSTIHSFPPRSLLRTYVLLRVTRDTKRQRGGGGGAHTHTHTHAHTFRGREKKSPKKISRTRGEDILSPRVELVGSGGDDGGESSTERRKSRGQVTRTRPSDTVALSLPSCALPKPDGCTTAPGS